MLFADNLSFQVFWDVTLSRQVDGTRRFEGSRRSHPNHTASHLWRLQDRRKENLKSHCLFSNRVPIHRRKPSGKESENYTRIIAMTFPQNSAGDEMWCWRRTEIIWTDRVRNGEGLKRVKKDRNNLHTTKRRKANWIGHILLRNCLLKHKIEWNIQGGAKRTHVFQIIVTLFFFSI